MVRILYNVFAALILVLLASCGGEDDGGVDLEIPQNSVQYDGTIYNMDFGLLTNQSKTDNHRALTFSLTDGAYFPYQTIAGQFLITLWDIADYELEVVTRLYSADENEFRPGTFEFVANADSDDTSLAATNFFTSGYVALSAIDGEEINVSGGTVVLSGEEPDYIIEYDLQLENGATLKGTYSGSFVGGKRNGR